MWKEKMTRKEFIKKVAMLAGAPVVLAACKQPSDSSDSDPGTAGVRVNFSEAMNKTSVAARAKLVV